jgi:2,4-dienoyl-CoA reductase-like NADH-dependent reductase (Old Yellow Enzyme family)
MSKLFEESSINGMILRNRFVRAATWEGLATNDGEATPRLIAMMASLAHGGVGLIISSHSYVSPEGQATPWQLGIYKDELISKLRDLTSAVHKNGGKMVMQLSHAGHFAENQLTGRPALAVSDFKGLGGGPRREITPQDIQNLVFAYAQAAQRAQTAGFDGIEIHSAHGYLLSQFLSPTFNKRQDDYGGPIENRTRIHLFIYQAIRKIVGKDYPLFIKMNGADFMENGVTLNDSLQAAKLFSQAGFDAIEVSGGIIRTGQLSPSRQGIHSSDQEAYFKDQARKIKKEISPPLILVGGLRSFEVANRLIEEGFADYISMSRPFIREPDLINRWKNGDRRRAACRSDNLCFHPGFEGNGVYCVTQEMEENKTTNPPPTSRFS